MAKPVLRHHHRARHGHGTVFLRETFKQLLDEHWQGDTPIPESIDAGGETIPVKWLLGQLWNCTDVLPATYVAMLELEGVASYAAAVRKVAATLSD